MFGFGPESHDSKQVKSPQTLNTLFFSRFAARKMTSTRSSLNPFASSFVPSTPPELLPTKVMAQILIQDFVREKRRRGEKDVTKSELVSLIENLIRARYGVEQTKEVTKIKAYISAKLSRMLPAGSIGFKETNRRSGKRHRFDMSVVKPLQPRPLLVPFWGLNRHEQALRPTVSLSSRPNKFTDSVWSVQGKDLKIWNPCSVATCKCPPMFGYSIPPDFFGNPFNLPHKCPEKGVHLSHYPESSLGNESVFTNDYVEYEDTNLEPFKDDYEDKIKTPLNMDSYSHQMKSIVSGVCNLLSEEDEGVYCDVAVNPTLTSYYRFPTVERTFLFPNTTINVKSDVEDNFHPRWENDAAAVEGQPEMKRFFSSPKHKSPNDVGVKTGAFCGSPCSVWCETSSSIECSADYLTSSNARSVINLFNDTVDFILNATRGHSDMHSLKPDFKRTCSLNDCYFSSERFNMDYKMRNSSRGFKLQRSDPDDFFKQLQNRDDFCRDDSGVISPCSSQEDVFDNSNTLNELDDYEFQSFWTISDGEDSLWQPLPNITLSAQRSLCTTKG